MKKLFILSALTIFLVGCGRNSLLVDVTTYRSYPSLYHQREGNFNDERLANLKERDVLFTVDIVYTSNLEGETVRKIYLGLTSLKNNQPVKVQKAIVTSERERIEEFYNEEVSIGHFNKEFNTYGRGFLLFELSEEKMSELTKDGSVTLEVFYEFPDTGETGSKIFEIERYEYKDIAWPT